MAQFLPRGNGVPPHLPFSGGSIVGFNNFEVRSLEANLLLFYLGTQTKKKELILLQICFSSVCSDGEIPTCVVGANCVVAGPVVWRRFGRSDSSY